MPEKRTADEEEEGERGLAGRLEMRIGQGKEEGGREGGQGAEVTVAAATITSTNVDSVTGWVLRERLTRYCDI